MISRFFTRKPKIKPMTDAEREEFARLWNDVGGISVSVAFMADIIEEMENPARVPLWCRFFFLLGLPGGRKQGKPVVMKRIEKVELLEFALVKPDPSPGLENSLSASEHEDKR